VKLEWQKCKIKQKHHDFWRKKVNTAASLNCNCTLLWMGWKCKQHHLNHHQLIELCFYFPLDTKLVILEMFPKPISWLGIEKLNLTQQKNTITNQKKCTTTQNKHKNQKPGLVASYVIWPGNEIGLFWFWRIINLSLIYWLRHLPTYSPSCQLSSLSLSSRRTWTLTDNHVSAVN